MFQDSDTRAHKYFHTRTSRRCNTALPVTSFNMSTSSVNKPCWKKKGARMCSFQRWVSRLCACRYVLVLYVYAWMQKSAATPSHTWSCCICQKEWDGNQIDFPEQTVKTSLAAARRKREKEREGESPAEKARSSSGRGRKKEKSLDLVKLGRRT